LSRPPQRILSRELIRDVAIEILNDEGLDALSMRELASHLGVKATSIYGYYANKAEILDEIADHLVRDVDTSGFAESWQTGLMRWGRSYRHVLEMHPNAVPLIAGGTGQRPQYLAMANEVQGGLLAAGWSPGKATMIAATVKFLVIGSATTPFATGFSADEAVYRERFPHLSQAHLLPHTTGLNARSFELGLSALVAGLEAVRAGR